MPCRFAHAHDLSSTIAHFDTPNVRYCVQSRGMLILDLFGGPSVEAGGSEDEFDATWATRSDTAREVCAWGTFTNTHFDANTRKAVYDLSFKFADDSELKSAFRYEWTLWQVADVVAVLHSVGFRQVTGFVEDEDDGDEDGLREIDVEDVTVVQSLLDVEEDFSLFICAFK